MPLPGFLDNPTAGGPKTGSMADDPRGGVPNIQKGRIVAVNIRDYTADVRTEHSYTLYQDCYWLAPYCHPAQGEGINVMPEVGSVCYVMVPSDNSVRGVILGWVMPDEAGSYRSGRELLNPGDLHFATRDGNFIYLRRGGIVQIGATPICQTVYLPIRNTIQALCENYEVHSPAGDLLWQVMRQDEDPQHNKAHVGTCYYLSCHEYADDPIKDPVALLKIGSHGSSDDTILTLQTRDKGGGAVQTELKIGKTSGVTWTVQKAVNFDFRDDFNLKVGKNFWLQAVGNAKITATGNVEVVGANVSLVAGGTSFALGPGGAAMTGGPVALGDAQYPPVMDSPDFATWVQSVSSALAALGQAVPPPSVYHSGKVKV